MSRNDPERSREWYEAILAEVREVARATARRVEALREKFPTEVEEGPMRQVASRRGQRKGEGEGRPGRAIPFTEVHIPSDTAEARRVLDEVEAVLASCRACAADTFAIRLALEEALVNAIKHGNGLDRGKRVTVGYRLLPDRFEVRISDEGQGFDPADVPDPTAIENLDRPCGRGLMLIRHYMHEVVYSDQGNSVFLARSFRNRC